MYITLEEIKTRGEGIRKFMEERLELDLTPGYETVKWIDGYITRNRHIFTEENRYGWAIAFGYLLGESMIVTYGGEWAYKEKDDQWGITISKLEGWANPIGKVHKYLTDEDNSLISFFDVVGMAIEKGGFDKLNK